MAILRVNMFKQRLLTALVLIPLVLAIIYYANIFIMESVVLILVAAAGWEWTKLIPLNGWLSKSFFILLLLFIVVLSSIWLNYYLVVGFLLLCLILLAVLTFPSSEAYWGHRIFVGLSSLIILPLFANSLVNICQYPQGKLLFVYLLVLVSVTDSGAYLVGKSLGRNKLIPKVSPGKTVEGAAAGLILAMLTAGIGYFYFDFTLNYVWFFLAFVTALISILGDLFISMLKRRVKLKDTGKILPGHGGILDRIDGLIVALPVFYAGFSWFFIK